MCINIRTSIDEWLRHIFIGYISNFSLIVIILLRIILFVLGNMEYARLKKKKKSTVIIPLICRLSEECYFFFIDSRFLLFPITILFMSCVSKQIKTTLYDPVEYLFFIEHRCRMKKKVNRCNERNFILCFILIDIMFTD